MVITDQTAKLMLFDSHRLLVHDGGSAGLGGRIAAGLGRVA